MRGLGTRNPLFGGRGASRTRLVAYSVPLLALAGLAPATADEGPRAAIELYFKAHALGKGELVLQAFSPEARISFTEGDQLKQWTTAEFATRFEAPAEDENRRVRRVEKMEVSGKAASAVLTLDYPQVLFTDHVSLLRLGGEWKIVSKTFSAERRDAGREAVRSILEEWSLPFRPRRIVGNVYYVGSNLISSFLIATPAGHILLDTGHAQMLPQVAANIEKLGFRVRDVKVLLNSHAHFDHCGGFAEFRRRTGAMVVSSLEDAKLMEAGGKGDFFWGDELSYEPLSPDRMVSTGDRIELGGTVLTAHLTPGHTKGCTSWSTRVKEGRRDYGVVFVCALTASLYKLTNNQAYPNIVSDTRGSLETLRGMHADVMLAPHGFYFDLAGKASRQRPGTRNPFVDPSELPRHLDEIQRELDNALQAQERQR